MAVGGAVGGAVAGGWTDQGWSWKGAAIGVGVGGLTGFALGGGLGVPGMVIGWGSVIGGAGYTIAKEGTDGLSSVFGGIAGGVAGGAAGVAISKATNPNSIFHNKAQTQQQQHNDSLNTDQKTTYENGGARPKPITVQKRNPETGLYEDQFIYYDERSFEIKISKGGEVKYRQFGGQSKLDGHYWSDINPKNNPIYVKEMGIPTNANSGEYHAAGIMRRGILYGKGQAVGVGSNSGGGDEFIIMDVFQDFKYIEISR